MKWLWTMTAVAVFCYACSFTSLFVCLQYPEAGTKLFGATHISRKWQIIMNIFTIVLTTSWLVWDWWILYFRNKVMLEMSGALVGGFVSGVCAWVFLVRPVKRVRALESDLWVWRERWKKVREFRAMLVSAAEGSAPPAFDDQNRDLLRKWCEVFDRVVGDLD